MKNLLLLIILISISGVGIAQKKSKPIYQFTVNDIKGNDFNMSELEGKKIMIVNTASKCGLTPQFEQLQELYETYKDQNFTIIGFPSNDFLNQDPGTNEEILEFCQENYGVSFPMMEKVIVKGKEKHLIYKYLTEKKYNQLEDSKVAWNFQKYLINEEGFLEKVIKPKTRPLDDSIID